MTEYILPEDVDALIERLGLHYKDRNLLLSALAAPMPVFAEEIYAGLHEKAAALLVRINRNHPLLDGNKRLSWFVVTAFYELNGYDLIAGSREADRVIREIAAGTRDLEEVEIWLSAHIVALPGPLF